MKFLCLLLIPNILWASIFDSDDRLDYFDIQDTKIRDLTKSTPALVRKINMKKLPSGDYKMIGKPLTEGYKFCGDANFATQPLNANCSAALIGKNKILTAAHCVNMGEKDYDMGVEDYYVVFDYKRADSNMIEYIIPKENVFTLEKELIYDFDSSMFKTAIDLAVFKLNRSVKRPIIKTNTRYRYSKGKEVFVLGYPLGIPLKLAPNGYIFPSNYPNSFRHDLDTFSVNSGSPVFDARTYEIIGVHVRGTGWNYNKYGRECHEWFRATRGKDYGEANTLHVLQGKI